MRGIKVLYLGCGTGYFSKILSDLVGPEGTVVGIDPDEERLKVAREKHIASNLKYLSGIAENIPGTDYDLVFSNHVIHWCKDKDLVFKQVHKSLKKGGKFAFFLLHLLLLHVKTHTAKNFSKLLKALYTLLQRMQV